MDFKVQLTNQTSSRVTQVIEFHLSQYLVLKIICKRKYLTLAGRRQREGEASVVACCSGQALLKMLSLLSNMNGL